MPYKDYDRYAILKNSDGTIESMPFVNLPINSTDKYEYWNTNYSRLDKISQKYYGNPFYDFMVLLANPMYNSEYDIPDGTLIRIPFNLNKAIADYEAILTAYMKK
jgi:hypothetical protein